VELKTGTVANIFDTVPRFVEANSGVLDMFRSPSVADTATAVYQPEYAGFAY
jgi:hypothetical protein